MTSKQWAFFPLSSLIMHGDVNSGKTTAEEKTAVKLELLEL